jgi:hypothetical protein
MVMKYLKLICKNTENENGTVMAVMTSVLWDTKLCRPIYSHRRLGTVCSYVFSVVQMCSFEFENVMYNSIPTEVHDVRSLIQSERERGGVFYLMKLWRTKFLQQDGRWVYVRVWSFTGMTVTGVQGSTRRRKKQSKRYFTTTNPPAELEGI